MALNQDTVLGLFENRDAADRAIALLQERGFSPKDISIITRDEQVNGEGDDTGNHVAEGALSGATTGGVIGALAGLLVGIGAIAVPGIGGLLVGGPLAAALGLTGAAATTATGAMTGALAGGLVGGLVGLGVPEDEARQYEERVKEGAVLLAVPAMEGNDAGDARQLLTDSGASQVRLLNA
jgi:uncharacterized membrane protein